MKTEAHAIMWNSSQDAETSHKLQAAATEKPRDCGAFLLRRLVPCRYRRLAIRLSKADFGGRVSDSGSVASGSSTTFSRSIKVGCSVLM